MNFTIDRSRWLRGRGAGLSSLLLPKDQHDTDGAFGCGCCVGQMLIQLGVPAKKIIGESDINGLTELTAEEWDLLALFANTPDDVQRRVKFGVNASFERFESKWVSEMYEINDDADITDAVREEKLTKIMVEHGHTITFVDGPLPWPPPILPLGDKAHAA